LKIKAKVMSEKDIQRALIRLAHEIIEKNKKVQSLAIVGIRKRGVPLAERLVEKIAEITACRPLLGILDITLYRDDLTAIAAQPVVHKTEIGFDITDKEIVLVDDVLYTGRTIRCALDQLIDFGRPRLIQLAVLIDRGHRELPIRADYVGKNLPTSRSEIVEVRLKEIDGVDEVVIVERSNE